jgi:hypothetical protein
MGTGKKYLKRLSDYDVIPATGYLIEPYVPMGGLVFVCGLPKTFKTYLSGIDWGYSVATGCPWLGRLVRKGRVAYWALEGYQGVLRRAEAWRVFHKHPTRAATDGLAYITDRLSVAAKTCNVDRHFTTLFNAGYRPDLVIIDTWFKVTAGAGVSEQPDMSVALKNVRDFQDKLTEWKVPDGLPEVTFVVIAHTDKKGQALFGSVTQFADCDVLYQLERVEHTDQATLECIGTRDIEEPPSIMFEMQKVEIATAKGQEFNLVVSKEVPILDQPMGETRQTKQEAKKAAKEITLDDLAYRTLIGFFFGPHSWTEWTEWFEITKAARGKTGLGPETFTNSVKRLVEAGRARKNFEGLYQVVPGADAATPSAPATPTSAPVTSSTSTSDFSYLGYEKSEKSEVTSRSTSRSARSNSTEGENDQNSVVPEPIDEPDLVVDALKQVNAKKKPA